MIKGMKVFFIFLSINFISFNQNVFSQSLVEDLESENSQAQAQKVSSLAVNEKIVVTSRSKRIFILSNDSQHFGVGDLATMLIGNNKVVRGIIAKAQKGKIALKVLKTFSTERRNRLRKNNLVQLIKGDDSIISNSPTGNSINNKIQYEDDLYSNKLLIDLEEKEVVSEKLIEKNLLQFAGGLLRGIGTDFQEESYVHWLLSYSVKVQKKWWLEGVYGYSPAKRFPAEGLGTDVHAVTIKGKYTFDLPFYSFLMPYLGAQIKFANSSGAGENVTAEQAEIEEDLIKEMGGFNLAYGLTFHKRFVPGWFLTANLGSDVMSVGLSIGF